MTQRAAMMTAFLLLLAVESAFAQVTLVLDSDAYASAGRIQVTATPADGVRVARPRFATIADGAAVPRAGASAWIEFPAFAAAQTFTVRAPEREGAWWLLLSDGDRLVGRVPFDVVHWSVVMARAKTRLESEMGVPSVPVSPSEGANEVPPAPPAATARSVKGLMRMINPRQLGPGETFEVVVSLPAAAGSADLLLSWGDTFNMPWEAKGNLRESNDPAFYMATTLPPSTAPQTVRAVGPFKPGTFELRLFGGAVLLDVLVVTTK